MIRAGLAAALTVLVPFAALSQAAAAQPRTPASSVVVAGTALAQGNDEAGSIQFGPAGISRAPLSASGWLGVAATSPTRLYSAMAGHSSFVHGGYLYMIGGISAQDTYCTLADDGTLGPWQVVTAVTPARAFHGMLLYNDRIYLFGGTHLVNFHTTPWDNVITTTFKSNGDLNPWTDLGSFGAPRAWTSAAAHDGRVYLAGGGTSYPQTCPANSSVIYNPVFTSSVLTASITSTGGLTAWSAVTALPAPLAGISLVAHGDFLYAIGGRSVYTDSSGCPFEGETSTVWRARFHPDGSLGAWSADATLPGAISGYVPVQDRGHLYLLGGVNPSGGGFPLTSAFKADGTLAPWKLAVGGATISNSAAVVNKGLIIETGGGDTSSQADEVLLHPLIPAGSQPTWPWNGGLTGLATPRQALAAATWNGFIYVLGGYDGVNYLGDVQKAALNADGTTGAWSSAGSFSFPRSGHAAAAVNGYLYVIGGSDGASFFNDVQYARINADGSLGSFAGTTAFTAGRTDHAAAVYNNRLYIFGGTTGCTSFCGSTSSVQFAPINANGSLGAWTATTPLTFGRSGHRAVAAGGFVYVIGGALQNSVPPYPQIYRNTAQRAAINGDGTLGAWIAEPSLATTRAYHTATLYQGSIYVVGGLTNTPTWTYYSDEVHAPINGDGSLGAWSAPFDRTVVKHAFHAAVASQGRLYTLGGYDGNVETNKIYSVPLDDRGTTAAWSAVTPLPAGRRQHATAAWNGFLYVLGGSDANGDLNDVMMSRINDNGTTGAWTTLSPFYFPRHGLSALARKGYLYLFGGISGGSYFNDVQYAPINADGTLGAWQLSTLFNIPRYSAALAADGNHVWLLGGFDGTSALSDVQYAGFNADGSLTAWQTAAPLNGGRTAAAAAAYNGRLYALGGLNGSVYLNDVQQASINADGTLGAWSLTTHFQQPRMGHAVLARDGFLYLIGGYGGINPGYLTDVQAAPVISTGALTEWNTITRLPVSLQYAGAADADGAFYLTGGYNPAGYSSAVLRASPLGAAARGRYSLIRPFANIGPVIRSARCDAAAPGRGPLRMNYSFMGFTGGLLPEVPLGDTAAGSDAPINYCQNVGGDTLYLFIDLDDSNNATLDGSGLLGRAAVDSVTVTTSGMPPAAGNTLLMGKSGGNLLLNWLPVSGAAFYNVYHTANDPNGSFNKLGSTPTPDFTTVNDANTLKLYKVAACVGSDNCCGPMD